ncbi:50S ribosomal protein L23 [Natronincola ferrireducens]|uniref:Large ribosomal subunit protein uL23 n=1 Tax=Natronincola ferrireducens TaxID=393762 RepID=A0A1G9HXW2_9FIRM|nr:50S ribosomal protein L23 [Natronincola ferrireducens]SDL17810.1 large subunit ribosomal protein L23 [Natronincola ferrireducens]
MTNPHDIVIRPLVTEESMTDIADKKYAFVVDRRANKTEVRRAIEKIFGVKVEKVNTMNMKGKFKRMGRNVGKRPDWKKAIVTLTQDSKEIEIFEGM